jgi:hypothetical protein
MANDIKLQPRGDPGADDVAVSWQDTGHELERVPEHVEEISDKRITLDEWRKVLIFHPSSPVFSVVGGKESVDCVTKSYLIL